LHSLKVAVSSGGANITPDFNLKDLLWAINSGEKIVDVVVIPGGVGVCPNVCDKIKSDEHIRDEFKNLLEKASNILTICTGSFVIPAIYQPGKNISNNDTNVKQAMDGNNAGTIKKWLTLNTSLLTF
jgi:imidazoleglycerol phosphate synthase glutamine amidotransferase subunit HisH